LRGIFICDRRSYDLKKKINYILLNYKKIQKEMKKNNLTTKKSFQKKLLKILDASYTK
jgi:hypothetical protein